jgi:hypothetical protein
MRLAAPSAAMHAPLVPLTSLSSTMATPEPSTRTRSAPLLPAGGVSVTPTIRKRTSFTLNAPCTLTASSLATTVTALLTPMLPPVA